MSGEAGIESASELARAVALRRVPGSNLVSRGSLDVSFVSELASSLSGEVEASPSEAAFSFVGSLLFISEPCS